MDKYYKRKQKRLHEKFKSYHLMPLERIQSLLQRRPPTKKIKYQFINYIKQSNGMYQNEQNNAQMTYTRMNKTFKCFTTNLLSSTYID